MASLCQLTGQTQKTIENCKGMRWATGYPHVNWDYVVYALATFAAARKSTARNCAYTDCDNKARFRHGVIGLFERKLHVVWHRTGYEQAVRMTRRRDNRYAEPAKVKAYCAQHIDIGLTRIATASGYLANLKRAAKKVNSSVIRRWCLRAR